MTRALGISGAIALVALATPAQGQFIGFERDDLESGYDLLRFCSQADGDSRPICGAYLEGVARALEQGGTVCLAADVETRDIYTTVMHFIQLNRVRDREDSQVLIADALEDAFPCAG